jgi:hypothetical protein
VYSSQNHYNDLGFAYAYEDEDALNPLFGRRDVISHTNVLSVNYAFNPYMTLNTRVRHYWGYSDFKSFYSLLNDGYLADLDAEASNLNFNSFTIDMVYKWIFVPGSELTFVWKKAIVNSNNTIPSSLSDDLAFTMGLPQQNSFSLRVSYFLDYHTMMNTFNSKRKQI